MTEKNQIIKEIQAGETSLGIEFGSTRIKAVLIGKNHAPIASGSYEWENQLADGIWTYSLEDIWKGLQTSYQELASIQEALLPRYSGRWIVYTGRG